MLKHLQRRRYKDIRRNRDSKRVKRAEAASQRAASAAAQAAAAAAEASELSRRHSDQVTVFTAHLNKLTRRLDATSAEINALGQAQVGVNRWFQM